MRTKLFLSFIGIVWIVAVVWFGLPATKVAESPAMKATAAMSSVWYLVYPVLNQDDNSSHWQVYRDYNSRPACERERMAMINGLLGEARKLPKPGDPPPTMEHLPRCVAEGDPRVTPAAQRSPDEEPCGH